MVTQPQDRNGDFNETAWSIFVTVVLGFVYRRQILTWGTALMSIFLVTGVPIFARPRAAAIAAYAYGVCIYVCVCVACVSACVFLWSMVCMCMRSKHNKCDKMQPFRANLQLSCSMTIQSWNMNGKWIYGSVLILSFSVVHFFSVWFV